MKTVVIIVAVSLAVLPARGAGAGTAGELLGPAAVVPLAEQQPAARIMIDSRRPNRCPTDRS